MEENEDQNNAAEWASQAAFEHEISRVTRQHLRGIGEKVVRNRPTRPLYTIGAVASVLVLIISFITINFSHNNVSIAAKYGINAIVARTNTNVNSDDFREAVQSYYRKDYSKAKEILTSLPKDNERLGEFSDWLSLLIELQTEGSKSPSFNKLLKMITSNPDHEFYVQAIELQKELNLFWRVFVIEK